MKVIDWNCLVTLYLHGCKLNNLVDRFWKNSGMSRESFERRLYHEIFDDHDLPCDNEE